MQRDIDMSEVSDGKLYKSTDMVKCGTNDCKGCSDCCHFVEDTIILDPYDLYELTMATGKSFGELLGDELIELNMVEGVLLPNIKMQRNVGLSLATSEKNVGLSPATGEKNVGLSPATERQDIDRQSQNANCSCAFLNAEGRCSIHNHRPGFCRLFPLGRIYEDGGFSYFLQVHECNHLTGAKIKIKKWLGISNINEYEKFVLCWHDHLRDFREELLNMEPGKMSVMITTFLKHYYEKPYDVSRNFYEQFYERLL